jgi:hypothetical protein
MVSRPQPFVRFALALVLLTSACAGAGRGADVRDRNAISSAELEQMRQAGVRDLYEAVNRLRPRWLDVRTNRSLQLETVVLVYVNDSRLGGVEALRDYPLTNVASLRYLDSAQAGLLPGAGSVHVEGAIVISTMPRT